MRHLVLLFACLWWALNPAGAAVLSGSVVFDQATGLYTYSYTVDNSQGDKGVSELSILVVNGSVVGLNPDVPASAPPWPIPNTSPVVQEPSYQNGTFTGFVPVTANFVNSFGGFREMRGSFYAWDTYIPVGEIVSGFSFSSVYAPSVSTTDDYFLFGWNISSTGTAIDGGVIELGNVPAPYIPNTAVNPPLPSTPEPSTWAMLLIGFAGIGFAVRFRKAPMASAPGTS
jgi:hypothetical protein